MSTISPIHTPECMMPSTGSHVLVIFNNDHTPIELVVQTLMVATLCSPEEAIEETLEAHKCGSAVVHAGPEEECEAAASVIERVGVRTLVRPD